MNKSKTVEKTGFEDDDDDVFEIKQEFEDLKQKKVSKLNDQKNQEDDIETENTNSSNILTGVVTKINNIDEVTVEIVVEYVDETKNEKRFELRKPKDETEFNLNNRFVRLVNLFGDRKNDPSSLKFRDIWLKKEDGDIVLDIPSDMSFTTKSKKRFSRKFKSSAMSGLFKICISQYKSLIPLCLLLTSILTFGLVLGSYNVLDSAALTTLGAMHTFIGSTITFVFGAILSKDEDSNIVSYLFGMIAFALFIGSIMYIRGDIEIMYAISGDGNISLTGETLYSHISSGIILSSISYLPLYAIINYRKEIGETVNGIKKRYSNLKSYMKRKYRSMRGIEYVKMES